MAKGKAKSAGPLDRSPSHLLHRTLQVALDFYAEEFGSTGITQRQFAVLAAVESREGLTQTELVALTGIDRSTLADMAARMIAKGLLERQKSPTDARANCVRLTVQGRAVLAEAQPKMIAVDTRLLKLLSGGKREVFTGLLRDLVASGAPGQSAKPKKSKAEKAAKAEKKKLKKAGSVEPKL
ncbi:MAG: MarR family transcriptional regulator [Phenylobacterium zucineum]|nr:MAG: MarR family transcriptional regulator [Phenylobacterium zucineum]